MQSLFNGLARYHRAVDRFTEFNGQLIAWLTLLMMVVTCLVVVLRYVLESGSIALQETVIYLHSALFLLGIAFTLKRDAHVRVDILYRRLSDKGRAWVDFVGGIIFLLPVTLLIFFLCWDYVLASWSIRESSGDPNGLPWVYLLKTLLLVMPVSVLLQATSEIIRNLLIIRGFEQPSHPGSEARV